MSKNRAEHWWLALVTFERGTGGSDILSERHHGAVGWMACCAPNIKDVSSLIAESLLAVGLRMVEIERVARIDDMDDFAETDEHLAANIAKLEPGKVVVWGTIHAYLAEGEG